MESGHTLFVLESAAQGIKGEAALRTAGMECTLVPTPRTLTTRCGVCLRVPARDRAAAEKALAQAGIAVAATHTWEDPAARGERARKDAP